MSEKTTDTSSSIQIFGKSFNIKCPADKTSELQKCARYVDTKMRVARDNGKVTGVERIAIMAALTITHELLTLQKQKDSYIETISERIQDLQQKIESVLHEQSVETE